MPPNQIFVVNLSTPNVFFFRAFVNLKSAISYAHRNGGCVYTYELTNKNALPKTQTKED